MRPWTTQAFSCVIKILFRNGLLFWRMSRIYCILPMHTFAQRITHSTLINLYYDNIEINLWNQNINKYWRRKKNDSNQINEMFYLRKYRIWNSFYMTCAQNVCTHAQTHMQTKNYLTRIDCTLVNLIIILFNVPLFLLTVLRRLCVPSQAFSRPIKIIFRKYAKQSD